MFNVIKAKDSDQKLVNDALLTYMLYLAMTKASKEGTKKTIGRGWIKIIGQESAQPLQNISGLRRSKISKRVYQIAEKAIKESSVNSYKELCVAISMSILTLIQDFCIEKTDTQAVGIAVQIIEEQLTYGDWGDTKKAKRSSGIIIKILKENNCYRRSTLHGFGS